MTLTVRAALLGAALAVAAAGCASVKQPSAAYSARAAKAQPPPGRAAVYVIRDEWKNNTALYEVQLDKERFGAVSSRSYLYAEVLPREHLLTTLQLKDRTGLIATKAAASLAFTPEAGRVYYFLLSSGAFTHLLEPLAEEEGRTAVAKLQLSGDSAFDKGDEAVLPAAR